MDIVYVLKLDEYNYDLAYSLRSVYTNVTGYKNIWCVGYKPTWVSDKVKGIITSQGMTTWKNALHNLITACNTPKISSNFILFNDDFFAVDKVDISKYVNVYNGTLDDMIAKYKDKTHRNPWQQSFLDVKELLIKLNAKHFLNFAVHVPMVINKKKFIELFSRPEVQEHLNTHPSLSYRNLYGNMYCKKNLEEHIDCKIRLNTDVTDEQLLWKWLSVYDNVTSSLYSYPKLKKVLKAFGKCPYEDRSII